uniref:Uncharacterized protein n=1 Tax=Tetranychus urticae TaxID=32264 RepID=T1KPZ6_TETUR
MQKKRENKSRAKNSKQSDELSTEFKRELTVRTKTHSQTKPQDGVASSVQMK